MDVYGLTGGIGSGKSAAAAIFEELGIPVVSADELSRIIVTPGTEGLAAVVEAFGPGVLDQAGELDRKRLGKLVFRDPVQRGRLEAILHPRIRDSFQDVLTMLESTHQHMVIYEVPLLFENNLEKTMKTMILVSAPEAARIARVMERDTLTADEVRARMATQMDDTNRRARANFILENDGDLTNLRRQVEALLVKLTPRAPGKPPPPPRIPPPPKVKQ